MSRYVHLHNHTKFSLLDGAITTGFLMPRLKTNGMDTFAVTDHGTMSGIPEFVKAGTKHNVKIIAGIEIYEVDDIRLKTAQEAVQTDGLDCKQTVTKVSERQAKADLYDIKVNPRYWHLTLLARNVAGYKQLCQLTAASATAEAYYYKPRVDKSMVREILAGGNIIAGLGCALSRSSHYAMLHDEYEGWSTRIDYYMKVFGEENIFCEIMANSYDNQAIINEKIIAWAQRKGVTIVPTNDCHYVEEVHARLQDILLCVATNQKVDHPNRKFKFEGTSYFVRSAEQMLIAFQDKYKIDIASWMNNSRIFADRCEHADFISDPTLRLPTFNLEDIDDMEDFRSWIRATKARLTSQGYSQAIKKMTP